MVDVPWISRFPFNLVTAVEKWFMAIVDLVSKRTHFPICIAKKGLLSPSHYTRINPYNEMFSSFAMHFPGK